MAGRTADRMRLTLVGGSYPYIDTVFEMRIRPVDPFFPTLINDDFGSCCLIQAQTQARNGQPSGMDHRNDAAMTSIDDIRPIGGIRRCDLPGCPSVPGECNGLAVRYLAEDHGRDSRAFER